MAERRYTEQHEWVEEIGDGLARVGITDHAQDQLGDIVHVELPKAGDRIERSAEFATIESVKAASDIYAPAGGEIVVVNAALEDNPGLVNESPEGDGWLVEVRLDAPSDLDGLMDAAGYAEHTGE